MENLPDYSNYVLAAYTVAAVAIGGFSAVVIYKYFTTKLKFKKASNEK
jgi:hypothetical protein